MVRNSERDQSRCEGCNNTRAKRLRDFRKIQMHYKRKHQLKNQTMINGLRLVFLKRGNIDIKLSVFKLLKLDWTTKFVILFLQCFIIKLRTQE